MPKICLMCGASFPDSTTFCPTDGSALRAAVQGDDLIGELVAERYLITDLLSQGGMGAVYLASDVRLPQQFAIKVLKQQSAPDPSLIARFRQEAEAVCRINHDRVARVFDFGFMADDRAYIVMEYVAGRTLKDLMEARGRIEAPETAKIIGMIAEGVDAAHRLGIIHRDLKPENVMILDDPGGGTRVKVLDFGIAKLQTAEAEQGHTQPGFVIGTPAWMSPEQLMGEALDVRSDTYSLGLIAFAMLTGERAFTGPSEQAEMLARVSTPPRTLSNVQPTVRWPLPLQQLFDRTFSRVRDERPATAGQFAAAIMQALPRATPVTAAHAVPAAAAVSPHATGPASGRAVAPTVRSAISAGVGGAAAPATRRVGMIAGVLGTLATAVIAAVVWQRDATQSDSLASSDSTAVSVPAVAAPAPPPQDTARVPTSTDTPAATVATPTAQATTSAQTPPKPSPAPVAQSNAPDPRNQPAVAASGEGDASALKNVELIRAMDNFDRDDSPRTARETILLIDVLWGRLRNDTERGFAENYRGKAHLSLGEKDKACAAFERSVKLAGASKRLREDSDEFRLAAGCAP